jgi:hypothetical protein
VGPDGSVSTTQGASVYHVRRPRSRCSGRPARPPRLAEVVACLLLAGCVAGCGRLGGEVFQATHSRVLQLDDSQHLGQTFRPAVGQLVGVDLLTASFSEPADPGGTLEVRLLDAIGGRELTRAMVPGEAVEDNAWTSVRFARPVAVGAQAVLDVRWRGDTPIGLYVNVTPNPPERGMPLNDPYSGGELLINWERAAGDLAFRAVNPGGPGALARGLSGLLWEAGRRLLDRPAFAAIWLLLVVTTAGLGLARLRRARLLHGQPGGQERGVHEEHAQQESQYLSH